MAFLCRVLLVLLLAGVVSGFTGIRLRGGKHRHEGRVEVEHNGEWKAVCDHGWDKKAAKVVCRMLGFPDMLRYTKGAGAFGLGTNDFWLDDVKCTGDERSIALCSHREWGRHNCREFNQAGVVCKLHLKDKITKPEPAKPKDELLKMKVRLLGPVVDDYISEGIVQVEHEGKWGYICPSKWRRANTYVLCGQLGFPNDAESYAVEVQDVEPVYWLDHVTCEGWESSIVSCDHSALGVSECKGGQALRIKCVRKRSDKPLEIRLRSGAQMSEGRVEIKFHDSWGTICDDHWTLREANVVCRSMGFGTAAGATRAAYFGKGVGKVLLDEVRCKGNEKNIIHCYHRGWYRTNCNHYEDAGVKCHTPQLQGHEIRLHGGGSPFEGRVEVFHDGKWGSVCADGWGIEEAMTVCRQLNLGYASQAVTKNNLFGGTALGMIMSGVKCRVDDISIYRCQHDDWKNTTCSKEDLAGVICVDALPDIVPDVELLRDDMKMQLIPLEYLRCPLEEKCLSASADFLIRDARYYQRRLLRFSVKIQNEGLADFRPNIPKSNWQWHKCHKHYHSMETFSSYDLITQDKGEKVAKGHKASFCLEDTKCDPGFDKRFNCSVKGGQGISPGCYDIYNWRIDCQWVDCTDFPHGSFYLRVHLNPGNQVAESDFRNNVAKCKIHDYGNFVICDKCWIEECDSGVDTHGGNSAGNCCVFPFVYNGKHYHDCTMDGYAKKWCSTTYDFKTGGKWGLCYD
ncbi:lysyl oxidase homolog 2A-like [Orbicella faveolata]|uniref:lysyl oxidase homolog 2A-like n=1 Tax=Orbicella faveolata TaxID=48498 RepID=UPI0009E59098|nr:lysyl oxidase homolog 2A-like [Orbicella faveolata]XP_020623727.1 lysyl oxidase homolog 2A-like [Orbicella faveolata]